MPIRTTLALLLASALAAGCASQQTADPQAAGISQQIEGVRQQQATLSAAQQKLESRLGALETGQAALADKVDKAQATAEAAIKIARDIRSGTGKVVSILFTRPSRGFKIQFHRIAITTAGIKGGST